VTRAVHAKVSGRVQGVFFRAGAQREAQRLGLAGWVKNTPEGGVEVHAEGEWPALKRFLDWLRVGPPNAHVKNVEWEAGEATGAFTEFSVRA